MKGVILAAGEGSRLAELHLQHKSFAVVNKKHIIDYSLDLLTNEGGKSLVSEIVVVVGHNAQSVMDYIGSSWKGIPVTYVYQAERKGIAHALIVAQEAISDDFILCLADECLFNPRLEQMVDEFYACKAGCVCGAVIDGTDFSMKPIAYSVDENNYVTKITEKPQAYENDIRGIGECVYARKTLAHLADLKPNPIRGEYEMGDWMRLMLERGDGLKVFDLADGYCNINYARDIKQADALMTQKKQT